MNVAGCLVLFAVALALVTGCSRGKSHTSAEPAGLVILEPLPGMPPVLDPRNIYSETSAGKFADAVKNMPARVYVPCSGSNRVDVIDPATYKVVGSFKVGRQPQHVVPSWDLKDLWVLNDLGDSITHVDPATAEKGDTTKVLDPYNMYYTPDGRYAIVVAERLKRLDFLNPRTLKVEASVPVGCRGVDHMDFSANGRYLIASCEFSGSVVKIDVAQHAVLGHLPLADNGMPQDVKLSPDGKVFYVADMMSNGVYLIDGDSFTKLGFIPTGKGTHGLYPSRDAKVLYVSNRGEGSVSVIDFGSRKIVAKWELPGGGSPDMGGVSADGKVLWLSGRYNHEVYAIDTADGHLIARIPTGKGPHGLCVYPQPGRYSLGHTGVLR
jgi:YVTN family beta-propeller protein